MRSLTEHVSGARAFLDAMPSDASLWVVGSTVSAARALIRDQARVRASGALSGWKAVSLDGLAYELAGPSLDTDALSAASPLALEAIVQELVSRRAKGALGRYEGSRHSPGLCRALARTLSELAQADVGSAPLAALDPVLAALYAELRATLTERHLVDRAGVYARAIRAVSARAATEAPRAAPHVLLLEVLVVTELEAALVRALGATASSFMAVVPPWDARTRAAVAEDAELVPSSPQPLRQVATDLFAAEVHAHPDLVERFSARSEREECAEVASRILAVVHEGTPFRRIAVVLADPPLYRAPLAEAFARAGIDASPMAGARRPDPAGRALLALIDCALEHLSARAFAEYLSFGVLPNADQGAPPRAWPAADRVGEDDEDTTDATKPVDALGDGVVRAGALRTPYRFERVMVDAAVVGGGAARWEKRLRGLRERLERAMSEDDEAHQREHQERRAELDAFEGFALPLLHDLSVLDREAPLSQHLEALAALATRALARPLRVLAVLDTLKGRGPAAVLGLAEVRALLDRPLRDVPDARAAHAGSAGLAGVEVLSLDEVRGRSFDHVFLPGMSERTFPRPVREDAILPDAARKKLETDAGGSLMTRRTHTLLGRDQLRAAVGAAGRSLTISHARTDGAKGRARLPSLYLLELSRASSARLPAVEDAAPPAQRGVLGAPLDPARSLDALEHGLSHLEQLLARPAEAKGKLRYLLTQHPTLRRAVRVRYARGLLDREYSADGLVVTEAQTKTLLERHALRARPYSATALESFGACPYRFYLKAVLRLNPREVLEPLLELDPLLRGSLVHSLQYRAITRLREEKVPFTEASLPVALAVVDDAFLALRRELADEHVLAVPGAIEADLAVMHADLRRWMEQLLASGWTPVAAELAFGLAGRAGDAERDAASQKAPVPLASGITLRGAIDLVEEKDGALRATDHKTGRSRVGIGARIAGGKSLQPALYAEALAALPIGEGKTVVGGRLSYCTARGGFSEVVVPADEETRAALLVLTSALTEELGRGRLLRRPGDGECTYCDFALVCGPGEEERARGKKVPDALVRLRRTR